MKRIDLQRLVLSNFKGFSYPFEPMGEDANVMGSNATGKTTLADAWHWLLFDKDSLGRSSFEIKNLNASGEAEHGLEHIVEAEIKVENQTFTLKKIYKELWQRKRGSASAIFTGHTTDYFVDGVPVKLKDYKDQVSQIIGEEDIFRLITSPTIFPNLPWQKQRATLLEVCGDMTDAQVIESDGALAPLFGLLKRFDKSKKPFDDLKAVIVARRTEINKAIEQIPVRIDEVYKGLPNVDGLDTQAIIKEVGVLETEIARAKMRLQGIDNGASIAGLSKRLAGVNADIQKAEQEHYNGHMSIANRINQELTALVNSKTDSERRSRSITGSIETKRSRLTTIEMQLQQLRERWTAIDVEKFQDTTEDICPACGQSLPSDRVEEARTKARAEFNERKAERLTDVEARGKDFVSEKDALTIEILELEGQIKVVAIDYDTEIAQLTTSHNAACARAKDYTDTGRDDLIVIKTSLERDIKEARESVAVDCDAVAQDIAELNSKLKIAKDKADLFPKRVQGEARIAELKDEEKELATEYEKLEKELFLCEQFIRAKVRMLTERINAKFEVARFKLFEVQVNGGISECCEITVGGVPYNAGLNNAARINAGLDVIRTLQNHYNLHVPIIIDNAESVVDLFPIDSQMIRLVVSEQDPVLRVEQVSKAQYAA